MPLTLDVFNQNAFGLVEMTATMEAAPYVPKMLGRLGLFEEHPVRTLLVGIESREGKLSLIPTSPRGTMNKVYTRLGRKERVFKVPHIPYYSTIHADDVLGVRAFGSDSELESVMELVADNLQGMKNDHEVTREWMRLGAVKGVILDSDADFTELYDLFDVFDVTKKTSTFNYDGSLIGFSEDVIRQISGNLGGTAFGQIYGIVGDNFFSALARHPEARDAAAVARNAEYFRRPNMGNDFYSFAINSIEFGGIVYYNYRGSIGDAEFVATDKAHFFPSGVPGLFEEFIAPADFMETAGTLGKPYYARQERMPFNKGVELHTQSNILPICTRPGALVEGTLTNYAPLE